MHELFEHTADLGLRATAPTLDALFAEMAKCLLSAMVEDPTAVRAERDVQVELTGADREFLLFDWLNELLFLCDTEHLVFSQFTVEMNERGLKATVRGEPLDDDRHHVTHEVKAITYHELKVEREGDGWFAEVIVDI